MHSANNAEEFGPVNEEFMSFLENLRTSRRRNPALAEAISRFRDMGEYNAILDRIAETRRRRVAPTPSLRHFNDLVKRMREAKDREEFSMFDDELKRLIVENNTHTSPNLELREAIRNFYNSGQYRDIVRKLHGVIPDDCGICLSELDSSSPIHTTHCGHKFHSQCWDSYLASKGAQHSRTASCPLCRSVGTGRRNCKKCGLRK
jgi:hypothetical protein